MKLPDVLSNSEILKKSKIFIKNVRLRGDKNLETVVIDSPFFEGRIIIKYLI